ncbi:hypothetical protein, partial [Aliivibrio fischeri]|uniref:hypothetical protein n=1 Tax=Aliivibrio fischeri TaxID=668 RepID=UPI001BE411B5
MRRKLFDLQFTVFRNGEVRIVELFRNSDFIWGEEAFSFSTDTKKASSFDNAFVVLAERTGL